MAPSHQNTSTLKKYLSSAALNRTTSSFSPLLFIWVGKPFFHCFCFFLPLYCIYIREQNGCCFHSKKKKKRKIRAKFPWFYLNILLLNPLKTQPGGGYLRWKMSQTFAFTSRRVLSSGPRVSRLSPGRSLLIFVYLLPGGCEDTDERWGTRLKCKYQADMISPRV